MSNGLGFEVRLSFSLFSVRGTLLGWNTRYEDYQRLSGRLATKSVLRFYKIPRSSFPFRYSLIHLEYGVCVVVVRKGI